jgi:vitamin B12 transporter
MLAALPLLLLAGVSFPQDTVRRDSTRLPDIIVSVSRTAPAATLRSAAATSVSGRELDRRGLSRLDDALRLAPGAGIVRSGAPGGVSSTFMRGVNSAQTLILIDGVRVNDANLVPGSLLGGFDVAPTDRLEVVRGPHSPLYGGGAVGGVIAIGHDRVASRGWQARIDAGSFATYRARLTGSVAAGRLSIVASGSLIDTDNQRADNEYAQRTQSVRLAHETSDALTLGATFRGLQQSYASPGETRTSNTTPVGYTTFENHLTTVFADLTLSEAWSSRFTAGWQDYFVRGSSRFNGGSEFISRLAATRWVVDWQHRFRVSTALEAAAGMNAEWASVSESGESRDERLLAGYAEVRLTPTSDLAVSLGLRGDDYTTFSTAVTGRLSVAYGLARHAVTLRASVGTGFMPPSLAARFGSIFQAPNPDIRPERSTGWDAGADVGFADGRGTLGATVFGNRLRDLIGFEPGNFPEPGRSINVARARTYGVELESRYAGGRVDVRAAYGYVKAEALDEPDPAARRLIRRPGHVLSLDAIWSAAPRVRLGVGLVAQLDREDSDFNAFPSPRVDPGDFADARAHASVRLLQGLGLRAAIDNVFGHRYEEVYGFPALGRRASVGLELGR